MKEGDKIRGFKFGKQENASYDFSNAMARAIDKIGVITEFRTNYIGVKFEDGETWYYPTNEAEQHLVKDDKPIQYQIGIDTFQRAEANMTKEEILVCVKFSIDKYNWRKKGQDKEDFKKIIDYANWGLKQLEDE